MNTHPNRHWLNKKLIGKRIKVLVVGAGGTGSHIVTDLAVLHQTMLDLGHAHGLDVTVMDFDDVSEANVGRARFYASDVGQNKAHVLVNRINMCYGYDFDAVEYGVSDYRNDFGTDLVIGCVDTRKSRREIWSKFEGRNCYWMDIGNGAYDGQVILGQCSASNDATRLPTVIDLYPEILDESLDPKDDGPSCSRREALQKQSAFVNKTGALHAINMLSNLFREGHLDHHVNFFNVKNGKSSVLPCDPEVWKRFGYAP